MDVLRLIDEFQSVGLYVGSVCLTKFTGQPVAESFQNRLQELGIQLTCEPKYEHDGRKYHKL